MRLFIDMLNPELIVLGSIYGRARKLIQPKMMEVVIREAYHGSLDDCDIVSAGLGEKIGDMAALSLAVMAESGQTVKAGGG